MLEIHTKYSDLIKYLFQNDQEFISALDKACASAVNFRVSPKLHKDYLYIIFQSMLSSAKMNLVNLL
jgi:hypothetical protein